MPRFDVTTLGEGQLRYSVPPGQRLEVATQLDVHVACTEANVSSLLARLGWRCGWISGLPSTPLGRRVANEFRLSGLDMSAMIWSDSGRLATYYVEYAVPPRATQVYYDRANTVFTNLTVEQVDWTRSSSPTTASSSTPRAAAATLARGRPATGSSSTTGCCWAMDRKTPSTSS